MAISRMVRCVRFATFGAVLASAIGVRGAIADGEPVAGATPNQASDASFDRRLPPVLPGERVSDDGHTMRVWSTTGPVPVASAPEISAPQKTVELGGVIVDELAVSDHR